MGEPKLVFWCETAEEKLRETHNFVSDKHRPYNAAKCRCGLSCSRDSGGGGWGPGEWKYFRNGDYTSIDRCPALPKKPPPVVLKVSGLELGYSVAEAKRIRDRLDKAIAKATEKGCKAE